MTSNLQRYEKDLDKLIGNGHDLQNSMSNALDSANFKKLALEALGTKEKTDAFIAELKPFNENYELWYSECIVAIRQLLPDRINDFIGLYERPKNRKELTYSSYTIRDYIEGLTRESIDLTTIAGYSKFLQQVAILKACKARLSSSLFEIRQLVQADLFDSEIEAAKSLNKHGFARAAGAIGGVILEKHLRQVCIDHNININKKHPGINDLNQLLKDGAVTTIPQWRHITLLGDIRNLCDHSKDKEPTKEQVGDLLDGVDKVLKTIS